jgi:hypothetical protein
MMVLIIDGETLVRVAVQRQEFGMEISRKGLPCRIWNCMLAPQHLANKDENGGTRHTAFNMGEYGVRSVV